MQLSLPPIANQQDHFSSILSLVDRQELCCPNPSAVSNQETRQHELARRKALTRFLKGCIAAILNPPRGFHRVQQH